MSHRVSYDQYGTAGGILSHDLAVNGPHGAGSGQQVASNTGRYGHISMSGAAIGPNMQHANNHNRNHQSSSYAGRITGQAVVNGATNSAHQSGSSKIANLTGRYH